MTRRGIRILLILGLAAVAGLTGWQVWNLEGARREQHADADQLQAITLQLTRALLDVRATQRAYLSPGQGIAFWKPRVDVQLLAMRDALQSLKQTASATPAAQDDAALDALGEATRLERRMAEHVEGGRLPHAADLMYADNVRASLALERAVDAALVAHRAQLDAQQTRLQISELTIVGLGGLIGMLLGLLIAFGRGQQEAAADDEAAGAGTSAGAGQEAFASRTGTTAAGTAAAGTDAAATAARAGGVGPQRSAQHPTPKTASKPLEQTAGGGGLGLRDAPAPPPPHIPMRADAPGVATGGIGRDAADARSGRDTRPARSERSDRPERSERPERPERSDQAAPRRFDAGVPAAAAASEATRAGGTGGHAGGDARVASGTRGAGSAGGGSGWSGSSGAAGSSASSGADGTDGAYTLQAAADLCVSLARVGDADGLQPLLARFADQLDAIGVIVWLEDADGRQLTPAMAHGYPAGTLALLHAIDRDDDNATAHAFRFAEPQIVPGRRADRPTGTATADGGAGASAGSTGSTESAGSAGSVGSVGPDGSPSASTSASAAASGPAQGPTSGSASGATSGATAGAASGDAGSPPASGAAAAGPPASASALTPGAIVVPMLTAAGCVGVIAAELRHGREHDPATLALARIVAAQLAMLTGPGPSTANQ